MSNLLYSVKEIFSNDIEGYLQIHKKDYYNIPVYQRGFKWKPSTVTKLLDDINNFKPDGDKFYCLQNITLVPHKEANVFNVVDGQQRLTTLVVVLSYLEQKNLVLKKVRFPEKSIREETNRFLNEIIALDGNGLLETI